ncbi:MAG: glycosyltransferase [Chitinophagaceae bacterium]|nr:MAG: glycosyltransferase [Chitinophagaceae bacterium]
MKVSIITISYNSCNTIRDTIESVIAQDYSDIEYIIIDGNSNDGTKDIINSYKDKISIFLSEKDNGIYDAMNKGISLASGDLIGIINSDDCYANNQVISNVVGQILETNCDALYGDLIYLNNKTGKPIRKWSSGKYKKDLFKYGWMPPHPTFFVKREIYKRYGSYNTLLKNSADYELMLRFIHRYEVTVTYLPEILVKMKTGGVSNSSFKNRWNANKEDILAWKLNNLCPLYITRWLKPCRKLLQFVKRN